MAVNAKLTVHGLPPIWGIASPSPFCLKLETWLRIAGIEYEAAALERPPSTRTRKIPFVTLADGTELVDSESIIDELAQRFGVQLVADEDELRRATLHLALRTLEEHTYFVGVYWRWGDAVSAERTGRDYFSFLPPIIRSIAARQARGTMRKNLWGQGIGRLDADVLTRRGIKDLDALSTLLGDREWFDEGPGLLDATAYGFFGNVLYAPLESPFRVAVLQHTNLVDHVERVRARYWPEQEPVPTRPRATT